MLLVQYELKPFIMKTKLLSIALIGLFTLTMQAQPFQKNINHNADIYHDLNLDIINDGTTDVIVASNIFNPNMSSSQISLKRLNENGDIIWAKKYSDGSLQNARVFDVTNMYDMVIITGSVDVGTTKRTFIAKIEATTGDLLENKYFDIVSSGFNSTGLNIAYTNTDATGDGFADPGFVVGGFFSNCYNLDSLCSINIGYVLRVDQFLNVIWTAEVDSLGTGGASSDYDFINKITETSDGFFLTGSATGITQQGDERQAALAYLLDYQGNAVWNSSYISGNLRDVSVDAYYEPTTGNIYMLSNYSDIHNFGITVFDVNGAIINNLSWAINSGDLDRYGFTLMESTNSFDNLIVFGYDRKQFWTDTSGVTVEGQSNVFTYEFEKATGNQVSIDYQYLTSHMETPGDDYNFWNGQMPLIYYPDMAITMNANAASSGDYLTAGYFTPQGSTTTYAEITKTGDKRNQCDNIEINLSHTPISVFNISVGSGLVNTVGIPTDILANPYAFTTSNCDNTMGTEDNYNQKTGSIYPNPTNSELNIYLKNNTIQSYTIHSVLGQKVKTGKINEASSKTTINLSDLQNGLYFINILDNLNKNQTFKFIKN